MKQNRREFLKKTLKATTAATALTATSLIASSKMPNDADGNGVVKGKSNKKEVLYRKTQMWEQYYKVAY